LHGNKCKKEVRRNKNQKPAKSKELNPKYEGDATGNRQGAMKMQETRNK
jgi:hypothetical protein